LKTLASASAIQEIRARTCALTDRDKARWGLMSVAEMVCHLRDAYAMALGDWTALPAKTPLPGPIFKWLSLWVPMQWPHGFGTVPELKVGRGAIPPVSFVADREGLLANLERFCAAHSIKTTHPMFGHMRTADWMRWGYLHADHHLRQFGR
jgi:hypothetical protein